MCLPQEVLSRPGRPERGSDRSLDKPGLRPKNHRMSAASFPLRVITPQSILDREATYLRLRDRTGSFGTMRGHAAFLTLLEILSSGGFYAH